MFFFLYRHLLCADLNNFGRIMSKEMRNKARQN